jgi:serine/threonine protein kinase
MQMHDMSNAQGFARKLVRPFANVTEQDILNEIAAVEKLYGVGSVLKPPFLVQILRHGWLVSSPYYFFDMELCAMNLEEYINEAWPSDLDGTGPYFSKENSSSEQNVWRIMADITTGLSFIHDQHLVHRDLKPRNGICLFFLLQN